MDANALVGATWSCPTHDLVGALHVLERAGFRQVEIWADGIHLDPRATPDVPRVRDWLARHRLSVRSAHLPFNGVLRGGTADERSRAWVDLCSRTLASAERLGARLAVVHPVLFLDPGDTHERAVDRLVAAADEIGGTASSRGIRLALENMHTMRGPTLRTVEELRKVIARMDNEVGICVDTGHAVYNGFVGDALAGEITAAAELLVNSHIHDSDAIGRDPHLPLGEGIIDWPAAFSAYRAIGYAEAFVLEIKGGADPADTLQRSRRYAMAALSKLSAEHGTSCQ
jgi:sugar phosphate isomerase/epimerase